ncbi:hypothetical protein ACHAXA_001909 [Cyclostephanos tholiformis]|uniref:Uncharacterized protein n=1 Tax=Cyclostephanos tholiformis TaxID=382380 RepID=A0ABD3RWE8_9STRA
MSATTTAPSPESGRDVAEAELIARRNFACVVVEVGFGVSLADGSTTASTASPVVASTHGQERSYARGPRTTGKNTHMLVERCVDPTASDDTMMMMRGTTGCYFRGSCSGVVLRASSRPIHRQRRRGGMTDRTIVPPPWPTIMTISTRDGKGRSRDI